MADGGLFTDSDRAAVERELVKLRQTEGAMLDIQARASTWAGDLRALRERLEEILNRGSERDVRSGSDEEGVQATA